MVSTKKNFNILVLDTGKEWGGGTNSLLELLKRIGRKYRFTALFYSNYKKGTDSDIKTELGKLGVDLLILEQKKQPVTAKILKESARLIFLFSRSLKKNAVFHIDYHFRIKPNAEKISGILKDFKIDLLYMNNQPSSNLEGIIASKMTGIPALQHSRIETTLNPFEVKAANRSLHRIICVSEGVKNELVIQGINPSKCIVIYNGIDPEIKPLRSSKEVRKKWGISDEDLLVGSVGSLIKRKRFKDLIKAVSTASHKTGQSIKCIIAGEGPERDNLIEEVKREGLDGRVIFTGFQPDAISLINAMDIFVLPSEKEGFPRVILEAMLMKKPVIASNVTGPSEIVINGETGLLVAAGKPEMLADAILRLIEMPELGKQMSEKARERIIRNFSIDRYVSEVEKVFAEVSGH
ncbi:MAG: glycosyltransferase [Odoribacter sp.]|nr:glycosyltransferase [Odoribacter sp.]